MRAPRWASTLAVTALIAACVASLGLVMPMATSLGMAAFFVAYFWFETH